MGRRISVHIEEQTLNDLMRFTGETSATKAVLRAVEELIQCERRVHIKELRNMAGKIEFDEEWLEQRRREHPGLPDD